MPLFASVTPQPVGSPRAVSLPILRTARGNGGGVFFPWQSNWNHYGPYQRWGPSRGGDLRNADSPISAPSPHYHNFGVIFFNSTVRLAGPNFWAVPAAACAKLLPTLLPLSKWPENSKFPPFGPLCFCFAPVPPNPPLAGPLRENLSGT